MAKKQKRQKESKSEEKNTLFDQLDKDILKKLKNKKQELKEEAKKKEELKAEKAREEKKQREKNKSFEELLDESNLNWKNFK